MRSPLGSCLDNQWHHHCLLERTKWAFLPFQWRIRQFCSLTTTSTHSIPSFRPFISFMNGSFHIFRFSEATMSKKRIISSRHHQRTAIPPIYNCSIHTFQQVKNQPHVCLYSCMLHREKMLANHRGAIRMGNNLFKAHFYGILNRCMVDHSFQ